MRAVLFSAEQNGVANLDGGRKALAEPRFVLGRTARGA
jgi:hypothetical protein